MTHEGLQKKQVEQWKETGCLFTVGYIGTGLYYPFIQGLFHKPVNQPAQWKVTGQLLGVAPARFFPCLISNLSSSSTWRKPKERLISIPGICTMGIFTYVNVYIYICMYRYSIHMRYTCAYIYYTRGAELSRDLETFQGIGWKSPMSCHWQSTSVPRSTG